MNRKLLEQPFATNQIKHRESSFGRTVDYVEGHTVIHRLNEALEGRWPFEVISHEVRDNEVIVLAKLTAEEITKTQFGSSRVTIARDTGEILSLADDLKAAATDALKKCATLLGVGLQVYGNYAVDNPDRSNDSSAGRTFDDGPPVTNQTSSANNDGRISNKQLNFIVDLGRNHNLDSKGLDEEAVRIFGVKLAHLKSSEASTFIDTLKSRKEAA